VKLRLHHHDDGARVAYREAGTGPAIVLVHSAMLTHREWEPVVEHLSDRFRVILPDLPLHGDSEDRPRHPYTLDWLAEVLAGFCAETAGARPLVGGHGLGAEILLRAVDLGLLQPGCTGRCRGPAPRRAGAWPRAQRASRGWTAPSRTARAWPSAPTSA
jgi:pimeloyl-ACP methyl ester carboxylesterase